MDEEPIELTTSHRTNLLKPISHSIDVVSEDASKWLPPKVFAAPSWYQGKSFHLSKYFPQVGNSFHPSKYYPQMGSFALLCIVVVVPLTLIFTLPTFTQRGNAPFVDCTYSSNVSFQGITMPYGDMSFAEAKAIDLVYNTFVGRGVQAILAYICYRLFTSILMRITEEQALPYELFSAIALFPAQWSVFWPCLKSCFRSCGWRTRCALVWLLLSTIYMALFPTIIDATSGYEAISQTRLLLPNGTSVDVSKGIESLITRNGQSDWSPNPLYKMTPTINIIDRPPGFTWELTVYRDGYSFVGYASGEPVGVTATCISSDTSAIWDASLGDNLLSQAYNGSAIPTYPDTSCENWYTLAPYAELMNRTTVKTTLEIPPGELWYTIWNATFLNDRANYECASQSRYQWGFSYAYLILACSLNGLWLVGTWIVWVDASLNSELYRKGRHLGKWRAILDMAESLSRDLGPNTCGYSNTELEDEIKKLGDIRYVLKKAKGDILHIGLATGCEHEPRIRLAYNQEYGTE